MRFAEVDRKTEWNSQRYNAATAAEGARILGIPEKAIRDGIKNTRPRGRVEVFEVGGKTYILDGGHNPCALEPLRIYLDWNFPNDEECTVIFGCLKDKNIDDVLCMLPEAKFIAVKCPSPRARSVEETAEACKKYFNDVSTAESVTEALDKADTKAVVVCGSFTLLKEAKQWIDKRQ